MSQRRSGGQLAPAQAGEHSQQHERAVSLMDGIGERIHLGNRERALSRLLLSRALDPARIPADHAVV
jgi:hypothetical protein